MTLSFLIYIVKISNTVHKKDRGVKVPFDLFTLKENYGALREIDKLQKNVFVPAINEKEEERKIFYFYFYVKVPMYLYSLPSHNLQNPYYSKIRICYTLKSNFGTNSVPLILA